jgi:hypothetical protein
MGKLDTAVKALHDAANAVEAVPDRFLRQSLFGPFVSPKTLRDEAAHLEGVAEDIKGHEL